MGVIKTTSDAQFADAASVTKASARATFAVVDTENEARKTEIAAKAASSHSHAPATGSASGFMSAADKSRFDAMAEATGAEVAAGADGDKYVTPAAARALVEGNPERPGEAPIRFTSALTGELLSTTALSAGTAVTDTDGKAVRLTGAGIVATATAFRLEPGHEVRLRAVVRRRVNAPDPANDAVTFRIQWLTAAKADNGTTTVEDKLDLTTGSGRYTFPQPIIGTAAGGNVTVVAPAGTVYFRYYVQTFGADGQTDVEVLDHTDLTDAALFSPDLTALEGRVGALESENLPARVAANEALLAGSEIARFKTRPDIAGATIGAGVDLIETLGEAADDDGLSSLWTRRAVEPSHPGKEQSVDGAWWEKVPREFGRISVKIFGAKVDVVRRTTGVATASSTTFTDPNGPFLAADAGKEIQINGAGLGGTLHGTTIQSVTDANTIVLADAPVTSVPAATYRYGTDDTAAFQAGFDYLETKGGGGLYVPPGTAFVSNLFIPNNIRFFGAGRHQSILRVTSGTGLDGAAGDWITNKLFDNFTGARLAENIVIEHLGFDGAGRVYQKWLQNPDTLAAITDPQNDYHSSVYSFGVITGKIGAPTQGADNDSLCLSQTRGSAGPLTLNGARVTAGVGVFNGAKRVTITCAADETARIFTVTGTDFDGNPKVKQIPGGTAGSTTALVTTIPSALTWRDLQDSFIFQTVTSVEVDGALAGNVEVGNGAYDIFSAVHEKRRNPEHSRIGQIIRMRKVTRPIIRHCRFFDHGGIPVVSAGCFRAKITDNVLVNNGRPDGANFGILNASYTNVQSPGVMFADEEYSFVVFNEIRDHQRIGITFQPTRNGGYCGYNIIHGCKEAGIYVPLDRANFNSGWVTLEGNVIRSCVPSDVVCKGIDVSHVNRVRCINNTIEAIDWTGIETTDAVDLEIIGGQLTNCGQKLSATLPFGPFGERWSFQIGNAPIAGGTPDASRLVYFNVGSHLRKSERVVIDGPSIWNANLNAVSVFSAVKTGSFTNGWHEIKNLKNRWGALPFWISYHTGIWDNTCPVQIKNIEGHASSGAFVINHTFPAATTGLVNFTPGFRPSRIEVRAYEATGLARNWHGVTVWALDQTPITDQHAGQALSSDLAAATSISNAFDSFVWLTDNVGSTRHRSVLSKWTEQGFQINVLTATGPAVAQIICYP